MAAEVRRQQPPQQDVRALDEDRIADAVRSERLRLSGLLEDLGEAEWDVRSLCDAWTVREVVAHLTLSTRTTAASLLLHAVKARGDLDRMAAMMAHDRAARYTPDELVRQLRESAESSRRMPGSSPMDPLMDLLVHGQDVARPLGRHHPVPIELAVPALAYIAASRFHGGSRRVAGLTLVATDADWSSGVGPQVRGSAEDLLLAVSGRPAGLAGLTGPGVDLLAARLGAS